MSSLKLIWADGAYAGEKLSRWCEEHSGWGMEIIPRNTGSHLRGAPEALGCRAELRLAVPQPASGKGLREGPDQLVSDKGGDDPDDAQEARKSLIGILTHPQEIRLERVVMG